MALAHTLELNAVTIDTDAGPHLQANWTWAPSALDEPRVKRLSQLWFEALTGICAHVRNGGGGLTPSDVAPARLSQQQIDELQLQDEIADILPLTPLQQGLLFHAGTAPASARHVCGPARLHLGRSTRPAPVARRRADGRQPAIHTWWPDSTGSSTNPSRSSRPSRSQSGGTPTSAKAVRNRRIDPVSSVTRPSNAVGDLARPPGFRVALIRVAPERHRLLLTFHHILVDGWSLPILVREVFAAYSGQRLPPAGSPSAASSNGWPSATPRPPVAPGERRSSTSTLRPWSVRRDRIGWAGGRGFRSFVVSERTTRALGEVARTHRTTVSTVLQGAWALLLTSLTGRHDVAFGTPRSRVGQAEVSGAESMVGLLINTVPVRARITPTTTTAELLEQLQGAHNELIEHQHLALNEIHRIAGHDQLFDTLFVYENYPIDTTAPLGVDGLAITEFSNRENNHYPLTVEALPGREIGLRVEYDADVFDEDGVAAIVERLRGCSSR